MTVVQVTGRYAKRRVMVLVSFFNVSWPFTKGVRSGRRKERKRPRTDKHKINKEQNNARKGEIKDSKLTRRKKDRKKSERTDR